ncbi:WD40 repeat domain-containing protein [Nostoc sp.]|uniref:WD40 repeat domain-containing protein n=1 Tax=Nostoc sp. TaxID=1180 RepID=UPI002FFAA969
MSAVRLRSRREDIAKLFSVLTLDNHSDWVHSVTFSFDGKTLVSGSRDMTIKLWRCDI